MTDNLAELKAEWPRLLDEEEAAFKQCVQLEIQYDEKWKDEKKRALLTKKKSEAVRQWWGVVNRVLWMFNRVRAQFDHELQPFPHFVLGRLANVSEDLGTGVVPPIVSDAAKSGRPLQRPERHIIAYAVLYIEAAKRGEIEDRSPTKTVSQAYNVTKRAVQRWMKRRDAIVAGVPRRDLTPEQLRENMLKCAMIYAREGRGAPSSN